MNHAQQSLFTTSARGALRPLARNSDPATSHESAQRLRKSGKLNEQCAATLAALREYIREQGEMPTAAELAEHAGFDRYVSSRRLPDLREKGLVENGDARTCRVTGSRSLVWGVA